MEMDSNLFKEVLEPLALLHSTSMASTFSTPVDLSDDDDAVPDAPLDDICE